MVSANCPTTVSNGLTDTEDEFIGRFSAGDVLVSPASESFLSGSGVLICLRIPARYRVVADF